MNRIICYGLDVERLGHRAPCLGCGEAISASAVVCRHCGESAKVNLCITRAVKDAKLRYKLAKYLVEQHREIVGSFAHVSECLESGQSVLARDLLRRDAIQLERTLASQLVSSRIQSTDAKKHGRRLPSRKTWLLASFVAAGTAVVGALLLVAGSLLAEHARPETVPRTPLPESATGGAPTGGAPAAARTAPAPQHESAVQHSSDERLSSTQIAERAMPSVVVLRCPRGVGSGFFVAPHTILTNSHATCRDTVAYTQRGERLRTRLLYRDTLTDVAVLSVDDLAGQPLALGDSDNVRVGDTVYFLGTPRGLDFTIGRGMVSQIHVPVSNLRRFIQIDGNINPGNSGGPVINEFGDVVGIVTLGSYDATGVGYALPTSSIDLSTAGIDDLLARPASPQELARQEALRRARAGQHFNEGPYLIGVANNAGRVVITLAFAKLEPPPPPLLDFEVQFAHVPACVRTSRVTRWEPVGDGAALPTAAQTALAAELSAGITYVGEFEVDANACPWVAALPKLEVRLQRVSVSGEHGPGSTITL